MWCIALAAAAHQMHLRLGGEVAMRDARGPVIDKVCSSAVVPGTVARRSRLFPSSEGRDQKYLD